MSRFSKLSKKGTFSCFACNANNKQPQRGDWSDHTKRSLCHRCYTGLVLIWDIRECTGRGAGLYWRWVSSACPLPWEAGTDHCQLSHSSRGGAGKSGHSREGLQFCRLQKSLWEFDLLGQWQVSKPLGILESFVPIVRGKESFAGRWRFQSGLTCAQLQLQASVGLVLPRFCTAEMFVCTETFVETIDEMWSCAKLCNTEMEQAGAFPIPTMASAWRRSKVGDATVFSTVAVLWINPLCSSVQEHRTDLAGVSMSSMSCVTPAS